MEQPREEAAVNHWNVVKLSMALALLGTLCMTGCEDGGGSDRTVVAVWDTDVQDVYTFYSDGSVTSTTPGLSGSGTGTREAFTVQWSNGITATIHATSRGGNAYSATFSNSDGVSGHFNASER
jgi:hypothetical protein